MASAVWRPPRLHYSERRVDGGVFHVEVTPGVVTVVAAWMFDAAHRASMALGDPACVDVWTDALREVLSPPGLRRSFLINVLQEARHEVSIDRRRGLDHGFWVPLMLMYPRADMPVAQLSVQTAGGPSYDLSLGRALEALRREGVLVVGSGSFTHNLSQFRLYRDALAEPEPIWISAFADWFDDKLLSGRLDDLADYRRLAPYAERNHRTEEHLMPLFVALGAAGNDPAVERLHSSLTHGAAYVQQFLVPTLTPGDIVVLDNLGSHKVVARLGLTHKKHLRAAEQDREDIVQARHA